MENPTIYGLMAKILAEVESIAKSRRNEQQNYSFRGIDEVYEAIHPVFAKHGVFTIPRVLASESFERVTDRGTVLRFVEMKVAYDFFAPDGSSVTAEAIGEAMDSGDKASNKAMSAAHKYALLQTFCIPTGDTPDADAVTHDELKPAMKCPECGKASAVIKGKVEYGGGWLCFGKKGGCGAKWQDVNDDTAPTQKPLPRGNVSEIPVLREGIKKAMQALNEAGDEPEWTVERTNQLAKEHFGKIAAKLNVDELGQLATMFSQRLETFRKAAPADPLADLRAAVLAEFDGSAERAVKYLVDNGYTEKSLDELSKAQLEKIHGEIEIPF